jgi:hypothetical protein
MTIERLYDPNPEALERVAEILYRLLVEAPKDYRNPGKPQQSGAAEATCVSRDAEG